MATMHTRPLTILKGDCFALLKDIPDNSIDSVVTDPPYALAIMDQEWDKLDRKTYQEWSEKWAREALRVLKPGGHLLALSGTKTHHRMVCGIEEAGFDVRDEIHWLYGNGRPQAKNLEGAWEGWGTMLKPAHEPICVARKPLAVPTISENVQVHGVGALNIEACKVPNATGRGEGRWPSNVVLTHLSSCERLFDDLLGGIVWHCSPGCPVAAFDDHAGIRKSGDTPLKRGPDKYRDVYGNFKGQESCEFVREGSVGNASRFFFTSKASPEERWLYCKTCQVAERRTIFKKNANCPRHGSNPNTQDFGPIFGGTDNPECICWENAAESHDQHEVITHPTIKPVELMLWMVQLVTPPKGVVLDPFIGTGTTAVACLRGKFRCIGMEINEEYYAIAVARLKSEESLCFEA